MDYSRKLKAYQPSDEDVSGAYIAYLEKLQLGPSDKFTKAKETMETVHQMNIEAISPVEAKVLWHIIPKDILPRSMLKGLKFTRDI